MWLYASGRPATIVFDGEVFISPSAIEQAFELGLAFTGSASSALSMAYAVTTPAFSAADEGREISSATVVNGSVVMGGLWTVTASKEGYITDSFNIIVSRTQTGRNSTLAPESDATSYRVVLKWGLHPFDLDSHLKASGAHVFYAASTSTYAWLDVDDTTSYGPETITITNLAALGGFTYHVHDFTNRNTGSNAFGLANSGAVVRVYRGSALLRTYYVPTNRSGTVWSVFSMSASGQITDINTFGYQSNPSLVGTR